MFQTKDHLPIFQAESQSIAVEKFEGSILLTPMKVCFPKTPFCSTQSNRISVVILLVYYFGAVPSISAQPVITFERVNTAQVRLSWTQPVEAYALERALTLSSPIVWGDVEGVEVSESENSYMVNLPIEEQYFRLKLDRADKVVGLGEQGGKVALELLVPPNPLGKGLAISVQQLPTNGSIQKEDDTPVSEGEILSLADLQGLTFTPDGNAGVSTFSYSVDYGDVFIATVTVELQVVSIGDGEQGLTLTGGIWDDILVAGTSSDTLTGNQGADRFVIVNGATGNQVLTDFSVEHGDLFDVRAALASLNVEENGAALDPFVDFEFDGTHTLAEFDLGADNSPDFTLLFQDVDLVNGQDDETIIDSMILNASGNFLLGDTLLVKNTNDSGPGSFRRALYFAEPGDIISFDTAVFPPEAPVTISPASQLPALSTGNLTIDASNAGVILDGSGITSSDLQYGLHIISNNNTIRGLQVVRFADVGIAMEGGASNNLIGGDREMGEGLLGRGNRIRLNGSFGIAMWDEGTSFNTIQGNSIFRHSRDGIHSNGASNNLIRDNVIGLNGSGIYLAFVPDGQNTVTANAIGTDISGETSLGNGIGILFDQTSDNLIGPDNIIAHNRGTGITFWENTLYNKVSQNSIYDNGGQESFERGRGILVNSPSDARRPGPLILDFDLLAGSVTGLSCANCMVEIFSDGDDQGETYEGQTVADGTGFFSFTPGVAFSGPHLTANATDPNGSTSEFSRPTLAANGILSLQEGNALAKLRFQTKPSGELAENRIGSNHGQLWLLDDDSKEDLLEELTTMGVKRFVTIFHEREPPIDWNFGSEFIIPATADSLIDDLADNGIAVNYGLHFWDKDGHALGKELTTPRFKTQEQIDDFLEYIRFVVGHLKGRVQYYSLWTEPDYCGGGPDPPPDDEIKCVEALDYINLARQAIPVIREEDPEAKVILAPVVLYYGRDWLFTVLNSDAAGLFDVIDWHAFYDQAPDKTESFGNYYHDYPSIVADIKEMASAQGFVGEYWGTDLSWWIIGDPSGPIDQVNSHTETQAAKYFARMTITHLGLDLRVGVEGVHSRTRRPWETMRNLTTAMAGASPVSLAVEIESEADNIASYGFTLPNDDRLFALWNDDAAIDEDPGVDTTLTFTGLSASKVTGVDVLNGFEQEMVFEIVNGDLVIEDLLIRDYPLILRLED